LHPISHDLGLPRPCVAGPDCLGLLWRGLDIKQKLSQQRTLAAKLGSLENACLQAASSTGNRFYRQEFLCSESILHPYPFSIHSELTQETCRMCSERMQDLRRTHSEIIQNSCRTQMDVIQNSCMTYSELIHSSNRTRPASIRNSFRIHAELHQKPFRTHTEVIPSSLRAHA
jgi:hypothetical protein